MSMTTHLRETLAVANLTLERFRELTNRLMAQGVLVRDEDRTEQLMYDDARRIEQALSEYFGISGLYLHHDIDVQYFRLYAPGAVVDGVAEDSNTPVPALRAKVSVDFVAAALALRFVYQERLNQGLLDSNGEALVSFEDLAVAMQTQLKRPLPTGLGDRMALLSELKRHRLLRFSTSFTVSDADAVLAIRPLILGVVSNEALATALEEEVDEQALAEAAQNVDAQPPTDADQDSGPQEDYKQ